MSLSPSVRQLTSDKGTWYVWSTPGSVTVNRAYGDMTVRCEKGDVRATPVIVKSPTKGMAFGNILAGGIIGAAVDAGTGSAYKYPTLIAVKMTCGAPQTPTATTAAPPQLAPRLRSRTNVPWRKWAITTFSPDVT